MATRHRSTCATTSFQKFLRLCRRAMLALPAMGMLIQPVYAQTWMGGTNNGTPGEFNWNEPANWIGGTPANAPNATATFGVTGGNINVDIPITIGTLEFNTGAVFNILGGANQLTFDGAGAGLIDIDAGDVTIGADIALTPGGLNIDVMAAPVVNAEISGVIGGDGPVAKLGAGTLVLSGANTYNNATNINMGTLQLGVAGAIPDGSAVTVAGGATFDLNDFNEAIGSLAGAGNVTLGTGNLTTGGNGTDTTFSGVISETGDLIKEGGGVFTLSGANTYSGDTVLNAGTVSIGSAANLGTTAGDIVFNGGTLRTTGSLSLGHEVVFNAGGGTVETVGVGNITTFTNDFSGTGTLTKDGLGRMVINNDITPFGGNIVINQGTLENVTIATETISGDISGIGDFVKSGGGILQLSGNNNAHVGSTIVTGGRLRSLTSGVIGDISNVFLSGGGVLDLNGNDEEIGGLFGDAGTFVSLEGAELITQNDIAVNDSTFGGVIIGNMDSSVLKRGDGFLRLTGDNTFEGELQVQSGRVALNDLDGNDDVLADRNRVTIFTDAELVLYDIVLTPVTKTTVYSDTIGPLSGNGDVDLGLGVVDGNTLTVNSEDAVGAAANTIFSGRIIGNGGLTKVGLGTLTLSGANTYLGTTQIDAGTLQLGGDDRINDMSAVLLSDGATFDLNGFDETIGSLDTFPDGQTQSNVLLGAGTLTTGGDGSSTNYEGVISGTGGLTKEGAGEFTLSGLNTYTGTTAINGGILEIGMEGALADTTAVEIGAAGTLDLNDFNETIGSLSGSGMVTLGPGATGILTTGGNNSTTTFSGVISGAGGLVKEGTGTFTVSGINTYTGPTMVNAGTLQLGSMNALPDTTAMTVAMGGTFDLNDFSDTVASLSGAGAVDLGTGTLTTGDATDTEFSGVISGTGAIVKEGTGTFTLSGVNTYSGGTTINDGILLINNDNNLGATGPGIGQLTFDGGTLAIGADVTTARDATLLAPGGGTINTNTFNATMSGIIDGAGALTKTGLGTLTLSGVNTYTGGTNINGGTLSVASENNLGTTAGPIAFNGGTLLTTGPVNSGHAVMINALGGTIDTNGFNSTFSGAVTGTGNFAKNGAGTLTFSGPLAGFTGNTAINAGILEIDTTAASTSLAGDITGPGGLTKSGPNTLTLFGNLDGYTGSTVINAGILEVDTSAGDTMLNGPVSGAGGLTKSGANTLQLFGMNTYTGPTMINAGILQLGAAGGIGDLSAVTVAAGATFDLNGFNETIGSLAGAGAVTLGAGNLTTGGDNTSTLFSGVISGTGGVIKEGTGTFTLTGVNTYMGGTTINNGILAIANDNNLGDPSGMLTFNGGTLQTNAGIMSARNVLLNAPGGTIDTNGFNSTFSGVISGVGQLTKIGAGTLEITGVNSYSGGTAINGGILSISSAANLGNPMGPVSFNGGTLLTTGPVIASHGLVFNPLGGTIDTNGFNSSFSGPVTGTGTMTKVSAGTLTLRGSLVGFSGVTAINGGVLEVDTTNGSTSLSGNVTGAGSLTKSGANTLTLFGNLDAYTGSTVINAGILEIDTTAGDTMLNGPVSGAGNLTKSGTNTLTLFGPGTWTGNTLVNGGILRVGAAGAVGDTSAVTVDTGATFDLNDFNEVIGSLAGPGSVTLGTGTLTTGGNNTSTLFSGVISGTGDVVKEGTGIFTLSGVNTYTGGTTINNGTVAITNDNNLGAAAGPLTFGGGTLLTNAPVTSARAVTLNAGGGTIDTNGFDSVFSGVFGGVGELIKDGLGTLTLSGMNTHTGGTRINEGILSISSDANLGAVAGPLTFDGGTLLTTADITSARAVVLNAGGGTIDTNSFDTILNGTITGPGGLTKEGLGTLSLNGMNTYTGPTTVNGGRLDVNGSITSNTTVNTGATLGGNGTIFGNVNVNGGATMAPGNSIGITNVVGTYTQGTNSIFELELQPVAPGMETAGVDFDQTNVTGNAIIQPGATVNVVQQAGTYQFGSRYRFLQTTTGVNGTYDMLNGASFNGGLIQGRLVYDPNFVELRLDSTGFANIGALQGKNDQAVAVALDQLSVVANTPGSDAVNVINQLLVMTPAMQQTAVRQIGGASHGTNRLVALQSSFDNLQAIRNRVRTDLVNKDENGDHPLWVQGLGTFGTIDSEGNTPGADYSGGGVIMGFDQGLASGRQGVTIGISDVDIDSLNGLDSAGLQNYNITAYSSTIANPVYLIGMIGFAHNEVDATRQLTALAPNRTAMSETTNNQFLAMLEYGLYTNTPLWDFQAYVSGQYVSLHQDGFNEFNANSMNLGVADNSLDSFRTIVGMRVAGRLTSWIEPEANLGFIHEFMNPNGNNTATFNNTNISFSQCGIELPRDLGQLGLGATFKIKECVSIYAGYDAMLSSRQSAHAAGGTLILNY